MDTFVDVLQRNNYLRYYLILSIKIFSLLLCLVITVNCDWYKSTIQAWKILFKTYMARLIAKS